MKLTFLLKKESDLTSDKSFYDFVPYKYGPFSFMVYRDLEELKGCGYLNSDDLRIREPLSNDALQTFETLPSGVRAAIQDVASRYGHLSKKALVDHVYCNYPEFAIRSELVRTPEVRVRKRKAIYTAGYEGESIDSFLQKLIFNGVERLVDVRMNPVSRKYGFSKKRLAKLCARCDIDYVHFPELGIPSSQRKSLDSSEDHENLLNAYEQSILPIRQDAQRELADLVREKPSALVCFEADVSLCHRGRLAASISRMTGMPVIDL